MPIPVHTIGCTPARLNELADAAVYYWVEAKPYYSGVRVKIDLSGSDVYGPNTYSYSKEFTLTRVPIVADPESIALNQSGLQTFNPVAPGDGECLMALARNATNFGTRVICPAAQGVSFLPPSIYYYDEVIGEDDDDTPILSGVAILLPHCANFDFVEVIDDCFRFWVQFGLWPAFESRLDISGWSEAKWRDLRGTYTDTLTYVSGAEINITLNVEWEIL